MKPRSINRFLVFKLPAAWLCGVRVVVLNNSKCITSVRYRWINTNPFRSMFWAVQGMAAELSTGALLLNKLQAEDAKFSFLVVKVNGQFYKRVTKKVKFICKDASKIDTAIQRACLTGEPQLVALESVGLSNANEALANFTFTWSIKQKKNKI